MVEELRFPKVMLKLGEERRLRQGHLWVFSNEVAEVTGRPAAGDVVEVVDQRGRSWGLAAFHPHSLITARLLGPDAHDLDVSFFRARLERARALREVLFGDDASVYRLAYGESDGLPGLVVDRYERVLVVQIFSAAMERRKDVIVEVLTELFQPDAVVERSDSHWRTLEGLPKVQGILLGRLQPPLQIELEGVRYRLDPLTGQKTGFFLDQRWNRPALARYCRGRRVLDCFCHLGGFALHAAQAGADRVLAVDASESCIAEVAENARLNEVRIEAEKAEVFAFLEAEKARKRSWDVIVLDPPSLAPRRKDAAAARKAYRRLNRLALEILREGGILATASCSEHVWEDVFYAEVRHAAADVRRVLQLLQRLHQAPDHPVLPAMPETAYLKMGIFRVL